MLQPDLEGPTAERLSATKGARTPHRLVGMSESPGSGQDPSATDITPTADAPTRQLPVGDPNHGDQMDLTPSAGAMGPPPHSNHEEDPEPPVMNGDDSHQHGHATGGLNAAAATSAQQPKVVQTAFIHKLYSMLEDPTIHHLISWSSSNESFVMSPTADFAKVLSQYFKHTNVSSFVRQLNMYGFHKVSDVFHTGSPDSTLWEFKHGNGNFRRGDLAGLREIKRRASRHALIHRDSYSAPTLHKPSMSQPPTPAEPAVMDPGEARLVNLEHSLLDMHNRLLRTEEGNQALSAKCYALNESLLKAHQSSLSLTGLVSNLISDPEHPLRRDAAKLESDISRQIDIVRNYEDPHESLLSGRQPFFANMALQEPVSPHAQEERRTSLHAIPPRHSTIRPPVPPMPSLHNNHPSVPQRRYGSIGAGYPLPSSHRPFHPQTQLPAHSPQHPLANVSEPGVNLGRRHTSADIRQPTWPGAAQGQSSPLTSGQSSGQYPSSPTQPSHPAPPGPFAAMHGDQSVRDQLASYEFGKPRGSVSSGGTHQDLPSLTTSNETTPSTLSMESNWSWGGAGAVNGNAAAAPPPFSFGNKLPPATNAPRTTGIPPPPTTADSSGPATRRSSMASNVHSLLNPAETAERDEEDIGPGQVWGEERKRKRLMA